MAKTMTETFEFEGKNPEEIFSFITDSKKMAEITGYDTEIGKKIGEEFTAMNGGVKGSTIHVEPGKMLVLSWRWLTRRKNFSDSILVLVFSDYQNRARVEMSNINLPDDEMPFMTRDLYWEPIKNYFQHQAEEKRKKEAAKT